MAADTNSPCNACQSRNHKTFSSEVAIHFPGLAGLKKPIVWAFPKILVCLDCGIAQFSMPEKELEVLRTGHLVEGAQVWSGRAKEGEGNTDGNGNGNRGSEGV